MLWHDAYAFNLNQSYEVEIVAHGSDLIGYFDGSLLFNLKDGDVASGAVGLYVWANPGAKFSALTVGSVDAQPNHVTTRHFQTWAR